MPVTIHPENILSVINVPGHGIFSEFWAEYSDENIIFGSKKALAQGDYNYCMNLAVKRLREYGFNAHRGDPEELKSLGIVYPPGVKPDPQTELGDDGIYHLDCISKVRQQFLKAMHSGELVKIDEALWGYYLDLLPPKTMNKIMVWEENGNTKRQLTDFTFADGTHPVAFWHKDEQHFCMQVPANAKLV